jgi:competence protein ComEC
VRVGVALCVGFCAALVVRISALPAIAVAPVALVLWPPAALAVGAWWWGSERLRTIDRSVLTPEIGAFGRALVTVREPPRTGQYAIRARIVVTRWRGQAVRELAQLELPLGRAPPLGAQVRVMGALRAPADFERRRLRLHGVHVVLRAAGWTTVRPPSGIAARLHAWLARRTVPGLAGDRRAVLEGVVLGEDDGLSPQLRDRFRAAGLYHLLAVSGGNVIVVAGGTVLLALALGAGRRLAEALALAAIAGYVLAVGPQPSVLRAGIAGGLGCVAWLAGRERDRRHALLVGAVALLGWSPYTLLDPGFQLSFAAVLAIFYAAPRIASWLEGYPMPRFVREAVALSAACGAATAPISWLHFHQIPLVSIPANVAAAPVVAPMLALALLTPAVPPLAHVSALLAAYLAQCARSFGGLPGAQIRSGAAAAALGAGALLAASYAWQRGRDGAEACLPPDGNRPAEDRPRGAPAA